MAGERFDDINALLRQLQDARPANQFTVAGWVPHCDDCSCALGSFKYACPACHKHSTDYDVWWDFDNVIGGCEHPFSCAKCQAKLVVYYDEGELQTEVRLARPET